MEGDNSDVGPIYRQLRRVLKGLVAMAGEEGESSYVGPLEMQGAGVFFTKHFF